MFWATSTSDTWVSITAKKFAGFFFLFLLKKKKSVSGEREVRSTHVDLEINCMFFSLLPHPNLQPHLLLSVIVCRMSVSLSVCLSPVSQLRFSLSLCLAHCLSGCDLSHPLLIRGTSLGLALWWRCFLPFVLVVVRLVQSHWPTSSCTWL